MEMPSINDVKDTLKEIDKKVYSATLIFCVFSFFLILSFENFATFFKIENYIDTIRIIALMLFFILIFYLLDFVIKKIKINNNKKQIIKNQEDIIENLSNIEFNIVKQMYHGKHLILANEMHGVSSLKSKKVIKIKSPLWKSVTYNNSTVVGYSYQLSEWVEKYITNKIKAESHE